MKLKYRLINFLKMAFYNGAISLLAGCATGTTTMLIGGAPATPRNAAEVQIFLQKPNQPYEVIALVNSSARSVDYGSISLAEGAALEQARKQAAIAGANGLIELQEDVLRNGAVINSGAYGTSTINFYGSTAIGNSSSFGNTTLFENYEIVFRGKAIVLK